MSESELSPQTAAAVTRALDETGHGPERNGGWALAPCPAGCTEPPDLHRHFEREPGVYYRLATPTACCGRRYARFDEVLWLDQCAWCWQEGRPPPGSVQLLPAPRGCRLHENGTWIHLPPNHTCPPYARNVGRKGRQR